MEALFQWISKEEPAAKSVLPKGFIWATLALSIIPSILVLLGPAIVGWTAGTDLSASAAIMTGPLFYNLWMVFGIATAMIVSCLAFADYYVKKEISTAIIGLALLTAALYDAFYFVLYSNESAVQGDLGDQIYLSWFISRVLHSMLLLLGTLLYLGIRPKNKFADKQKRSLLIKTSFLFAIMLIGAVLLTRENPYIPYRLINSFLTHPLALIPLVIYLGWGLLILPAFLKQNSSVFSKVLVLSIVPAVIAQCLMATHQYSFDSRFNIAYFLGAVNYIVPLFGISMNYMNTIRNEKRIIEQLDNEVNERIQAQQILEKREALLASAEQIAGLGSWEFDTETGEVKWSDGMFRIFGYKVQQVQPSITLQEKLTAPEFREDVKKGVLTAIRRKSSYSIEYEVLRPGGKRRSVLAQGQFITNGNKLVGTLLDITELKEANQQLAHNQALLKLKIEELNRSNTELEQFAYVASHDLQEPLRKIRAFGERIEGKFTDLLPADGLDYLHRMRTAAERMQTLIDDLLTFSRLTRTSDPYVTLELSSVVESVTSDLEYIIEKKCAQIQVDAVHALQAVPGQLRQLFQNLISNALKFSRADKSPEIKITSSVVTGSEEFNYLKPGAAYCRITIQDNGIGFDSQYSDKIFVLFQRLHSRSEYEGTGIGLAICKKIVENHNGFIQAQSTEGTGATFTIFLPITQEI